MEREGGAVPAFQRTRHSDRLSPCPCREKAWEGIKVEPKDKRGRPLHQVKKMSGRRTRAEALEVGLEGLEKVCHVTSVPE